MKLLPRRSIKIMLLGLIIGFALSIILAPQTSHAEEGVFCAAVFPCDEVGELLAQFDLPNDPCGAVYAGICKDFRNSNRKECSVISDQYNSLQVTVSSKQEKLAKLRKRLRKLRKASQH